MAEGVLRRDSQEALRSSTRPIDRLGVACAIW